MALNDSSDILQVFDGKLPPPPNTTETSFNWARSTQE